MDVRPKTVCVLSLFAAYASAGCGYNHPSRFQTSFLPPAPLGVTTLAEPPVVYPNSAGPNPYLKDASPLFLGKSTLSPLKSQADDTVRRAVGHFQTGRRYYQANDLVNARSEFNTAVDLMLEASSQFPTDRHEYERKLEEMVDTIHRFDLAGLGASEIVEPGKFE